MENNPYLTEIGKNIKAARKAKKVSLQELSKQCQMDISNLCNVENGKKNVRLLTLKSIAEVLKMNVKDFF